jgi:glycerophosphoryl diester phosphodiesterase
MHGKFLISSFSIEVLRAVEHVREQHRGVNEEFDIIYLYNEENCPLPHPDHYTAYGDGINISANHINEEVVQYCKNKGLKVGVWISKKDFTENDEFYHKMFNMGVDFIVVDQPLKAMEARTVFFENSQ